MYNAKTSKECWDKLADQYQGEGDQRIIYMLEKLLMTPLVDTEPLRPQINALILASQQLATAGLIRPLTVLLS